MANKKLWAGRFKEKTDVLVEKFTSSIEFDRILYRYDIMGSIAHGRMLKKQQIIPAREADLIISGLQQIEKEIEQGKVRFSASLEDIHMHIEAMLTKKIGPAGGKLHTARSRNVRFYGGSFVADPWGKVLGRASTSRPELLLVELDTSQIRDARSFFGFLDTRQPNTYGELTIARR